MSIVSFQETPDEDLACALEAFEQQFIYPLGPGRSFRIEHGCDYARFYRSQGEARCFVGVEAGRVLGVLCVALRPLLINGETRQVAYIGDLKVSPEARAGFTLHRLAREAMTWVGTRVASAYGVVMDGTQSVPAMYTGRTGIPAFDVVGRLMIYRLDCGQLASRVDSNSLRELTTVEADARACFRRLSCERVACPPGQPSLRSTLDPVWLMLPDGSACGCLEDTRRAKRLIADDNKEMVSAHLSCFAFLDPASGASLLRSALQQTTALGYPALFVAVDASDAPAFDSLLRDVETVRAPATVYGHRVPAGAWLVPTSEI